MGKLIDTVGISAVAATMLAASLSGGKAPARTGHFPPRTTIPGFPYSQGDLLRMKATGNMAEIRNHSWDLFAGLTKDLEPQWETWYTKCDIPLDNAHCGKPGKKTNVPDSLRNAEFPVQVTVPMLPSPQLKALHVELSLPEFLNRFVDTPNVSQVFFNPELTSFIRARGLNKDASLKQMLPKPESTVSAPREAPDPPQTAIAVKTMWQQVVVDLNSHANPQPWILHLWHSSLLNSVAHADTGGEAGNLFSDTTGPAVVQIDMNHTSPSDCSKQDYPLGTPVPLGCFRFVKLDGNQFQEISTRIGLHPQRVGNPPYYLVLVGVHIMTKEVPEWTWQTFYWSSDAVAARQKLNESVKLGAQWSHFEMAATLDADTPPDPRTHGQNICSNPYLEGQIPNGMSSNCLFCHTHASYSKVPDRGTENDIGSPQYMQGHRQLTPRSEQAFLSHSVKTDFLWSIANIGQGDTTKALQNLLQQYFDSQIK